MTITRELIESLRPGDVIELRYVTWPEGQKIVGPLTDSRRFGGFNLDYLVDVGDKWELTVVSRAPRPLYVNHPRTSTWPGDVVRSVGTVNNNQWMCLTRDLWVDLDGDVMPRVALPKQIVLLVDGETGQVVT